MEYKVPFLCVDKDMQTRRKALGYYINNLMSADKFDIESAMPIIRDFIKKDRDVLETNVDKVVRFLAKVGSKKVRTPTEGVENPTEWFCKRLAALLENIKPTDYFLHKFGYEYVKADIDHEWIQTFFEYRGPHRAALIEGVAYAIKDSNKKEDGLKELFRSLKRKISDPESLPVFLYTALLKIGKTYKVKNWYKFTKTNASFGRTAEEKKECFEIMVSQMFKRIGVDNNNALYEERQKAIEGLKLCSKMSDSMFIVEQAIKRIKSINNRSKYLMYRGICTDSSFSKYASSVHKIVDPKISFFASAYEKPYDASIFKKLSWKDKVMLYERFGKETKKKIRDKCASQFEGYLEKEDYQKELFYAFKILSGNKDFLKKYLYDKRLYKMSLFSSKLRILYLEKLINMNYDFTKVENFSMANSFYDKDLQAGFIFLPSKRPNSKYRSLVISLDEKDNQLICEVLSKTKNSKFISYSATKIGADNNPKSIYPNINKNVASLFVQKVFQSKSNSFYCAALEFLNQFSN